MLIRHHRSIINAFPISICWFHNLLIAYLYCIFLFLSWTRSPDSFTISNNSRFKAKIRGLYIFLSLCSSSHISVLERSQMFGGCEPTTPLIFFFCARLKMETQKGREDIFGFQMQNDSEYAMRQREPVSLGYYFHSQTLSHWSGLDWEDGPII